MQIESYPILVSYRIDKKGKKEEKSRIQSMFNNLEHIDRTSYH